MYVALIASSNAYAEDNEPYAELETINITAQTESYLESEASSATGLSLEAVKTPQSTSVVTEEFFEDNNVKNVQALVESTPGVSVQKFDGGKTFFYARGFQIDDYQVDGMDVPRDPVWSTSDHLASTAVYEKAEIVRGATGLMTGSGTPSASINMIRKRADSTYFTGKASANYDQYGGYGVTLDVGGGLIPNGRLRGRFIADYKDGDTYIDLQQQQNQTLYGVVDADVTDSTTVSVGAKVTDTNQRGTMFGGLPPYFKDGSKTDFDVSKTTSTDWANWGVKGTEYFANIDQQITDNVALQIGATHLELENENRLLYMTDLADQPNIAGLADFGLAIVGGVGLQKDSGKGLIGTLGRYNADWKSDTANAKLTADFTAFGKQHQFVLGGSYEELAQETRVNRSSELLQSLFVPIANFNTWNGSEISEPKWNDNATKSTREIKETGLFTAAQLQLADPLTVILGTRLSNFELKDGGTFNTLSKAKDIVTPYVGVTYEFADNQNIYASYTDIFQPQRVRDKDKNILDPVTGENYEVGFKGTNEEGTLQAQIAVFYIKQNNLAQPTGESFSILEVFPPEAIYVGADGAISKGIDAEITGMINPNWQASIGYTHFTAKDKDENTLNSNTPHQLVKIATTYDMGNYINGLTLGGGLNYSGERYALFNKPTGQLINRYEKVQYTQKPVLLANVMARYEVNENLALQLNVDNLFNEKYVNGLNQFQQIYYGEPLTMTGKLTYEW